MEFVEKSGFDGGFAVGYGSLDHGGRPCPRGPDASGVVVRGMSGWDIAIAYPPISPTSRSSPWSILNLGLSLVFNGCIYNFRELRAALEEKGYRFFSSGDTEVILKAWHAWGEECVSRFHGMFAFVIHERDSDVSSWRATVSASSRSISPKSKAPCASLPPCPRSSRRVASTPRSTWLRSTITMTLPRGRAAAAHDPEWRAQAAACDPSRL